MNQPDAIAAVKERVGTFYHITRSELEGMNRERRFAWPRQVAMTLARELTSKSLPQIGAAFYRDHTTVLHAIQNVHYRTALNERLLAELDELRLALKIDAESWLVRFKTERQACDSMADFLMEFGQWMSGHGKGV